MISQKLLQIQSEYLILLNNYQEQIISSSFDLSLASICIEESKKFWYKYLDIIEYEIRALTQERIGYFLAGAIYLDVKDQDHYSFLSMGDFHIINDPLSKLEAFIRLPADRIQSVEFLDYFHKTILDTHTILSNLNNHILICPIKDILQRDRDSLSSTIESLFESTLKNILSRNINCVADFISKYKNYEEIENDLLPGVLDQLIFSETSHTEKSLRDKITFKMENKLNISKLIHDKSESEIFIISLQQRLYQSLEIIVIYLEFNLFPLIRERICFHYFSLILGNLTNDDMLNNMYLKAKTFLAINEVLRSQIPLDITLDVYLSKIKSISFELEIAEEIKYYNNSPFEMPFRNLISIAERNLLPIVNT
jgi:hypothetical protein